MIRTLNGYLGRLKNKIQNGSFLCSGYTVEYEVTHKWLHNFSPNLDLAISIREIFYAKTFAAFRHGVDSYLRVMVNSTRLFNLRVSSLVLSAIGFELP